MNRYSSVLLLGTLTMTTIAHADALDGLFDNAIVGSISQAINDAYKPGDSSDDNDNRRWDDENQRRNDDERRQYEDRHRQLEDRRRQLDDQQRQLDQQRRQLEEDERRLDDDFR
ncbi:hypothetical protein M975_4128 [Buttiauxella brennerae ATCC 51605]|uniref:Uncharacterized protein YjdP n=1 Tax=Buttiauxella brennerae ATCC 51605 TaxID=1354251 RepID=A0A1B7IE36_9ENTR|nr:DDRRRQL repeat protein YjdP [Buttiauxella brennerae]OAT27577.1 hypothetical protein M975_4128 [Buttiauxella brennerae ATCC 51605]